MSARGLFLVSCVQCCTYCIFKKVQNCHFGLVNRAENKIAFACLYNVPELHNVKLIALRISLKKLTNIAVVYTVYCAKKDNVVLTSHSPNFRLLSRVRMIGVPT